MTFFNQNCHKSDIIIEKWHYNWISGKLGVLIGKVKLGMSQLEHMATAWVLFSWVR